MDRPTSEIPTHRGTSSSAAEFIRFKYYARACLSLCLQFGGPADQIPLKCSAGGQAEDSLCQFILCCGPNRQLIEFGQCHQMGSFYGPLQLLRPGYITLPESLENTKISTAFKELIADS